jgi:hypothetical protein
MRALLVCARQGPARLSARDIAVLDARLRPDNLRPRAPRVLRDEGVVAVIFNPPERMDTRGASVCVGTLCAGRDAWAAPGAAVPDGSFALLRVGNGVVELVADAVASRTVWYVLTPDLFIASTSQRAVAAVLRSFELDRRAVAWMLSSGSLGPGLGWDVRASSVPAGGRARLDRANWRLAVEQSPIEIGGESPSSRFGGDELSTQTAGSQPSSTEPRGDEPPIRSRLRCAFAGIRRDRHRRRLEHVVEQAFAGYEFDRARWVLPLSGGVDSRGILLFLDDAAHCRSVTWGVARSLEDPRSDGRVAERLARHYGLSHRFLPIEVSKEPRERLIERFLVAGEGRTDRLSGYLDGFEIWRVFAEQGCAGVIRGDEAFGWNAVRSEADVLRECGITRLDGLLGWQRRAAFGLPDQPLPPALERRAGESLAAWRDRLYQRFRLPVQLAALTDLKCAYVEVANPLLSSSVVECVRTLPDRLRTDKRLWRKIVTQRSPPIPFAARTGVYSLRDFVREPATLELMLEDLGSEAARDVLGDELAWCLYTEVERLRANDDAESAGNGRRRAGEEQGRRISAAATRRPSARSAVGRAATGRYFGASVGRHGGGRMRRLLGRGARAILGAPERVAVEREILAFRAFLIVRTAAMLGRDAGALDVAAVDAEARRAETRHAETRNAETHNANVPDAGAGNAEAVWRAVLEGRR